MPVLFDSSATGTSLVGNLTTSGTKTLTHNVSTRARDTVVGYVALLWTGEADTSSAVFSATWDGDAMTLVDEVRWNSDKEYLGLYKLEDAPKGSSSVVGSFASMPTELILTRNFQVISLSYSGVDTVSDPESDSGDSGTSNTVTIASVRAAHRVLSVHGVGQLNYFTAYNKTKRATTSMFGGGQIWTGDAAGAASVTCTATINSSTTDQGVIAVTMTPSVVELTAGITVTNTMRASLAKLRFTEVTSPDRDYIVPAINSADPLALAGDFVVSADGVAMPVWVKDPDDTLEYTLRWHLHLADDDEIVHVEHLVSSPLRMESEAIDPDGNPVTQVWLSGGTPNATLPVRVRFTTLKGRRHDRTFYITGSNN